MTDKSVNSRKSNPSHALPVLGRNTLAFVCCVLASLLFLSGCSKNYQYTDTKKEGPVVILGDSLSEGVDIKTEETFVAVLSKRLGVEIVNLGKKGITTGESLPRIDKEVLPLKPALVIIELGGNDALQDVEPDVTQKNLQSMIDKVHATKTPVLLLGVRGGVFNDKFENMFEDLASSNDIAYVSDILAGILKNPGLKVDTIHPNAKGHEVLADRVEPTLRDVLKRIGKIK